MPKAKLTDATLRSLPVPDKGQSTYWDAGLPTFGVRVSQGGSKTFILMRSGNRQTIGRYPIMSLADARERARKAIYDAKYAPARKVASTPYPEAVERYLKVRQAEISAAAYSEYRRYLQIFAFKGALGDISPGAVADMLARQEGQSSKAHAYRALKTFFNWCIERELMAENPMAKLSKPKEPESRERTLTNDELKAIWNALYGWPDIRYCVIVRLLMLTGQRANQFAALRSDWIRSGAFHFPNEIMKAGKAHTLPFGEETERQLRLITAPREHYFAPPGMDRPFTAWSKNKAVLDGKIDLPHWTIHDLRRTWSTNAARLGIRPEITERILAHTTPGGNKIAAIYNRYRFEEEMRDAMLRMERFILDLVEPLNHH